MRRVAAAAAAAAAAARDTRATRAARALSLPDMLRSPRRERERARSRPLLTRPLARRYAAAYDFLHLEITLNAAPLALLDPPAGGGAAGANATAALAPWGSGLAESLRCARDPRCCSSRGRRG